MKHFAVIPSPLARLVTALCACAWLSLPVPPSVAGTHHEEIVKSSSRQQRREFGNLQSLSSTALADIAAQTKTEKLEEQTRAILALGNLSIGLRPLDDHGHAPVHRLVLDRIRALEPRGVEFVGSLKGTVAAPVTISPGRVTVNNQTWNAHPFWPAGALPTLCPEGGLKGPLVYVGGAELEDLKGLNLRNAVALMTFEGGRNWEELFSLGAQAVVVIEDDFVVRQKAEMMFSNTPVPFPRFYVDRATGGQLRVLATRKELGADGQSRILPGQTALLEGGQVYENRPWESLFAYLPPTDPVVYEVRENDLLQRVAAETGVSAEELATLNKLQDQPLTTGFQIAIPRSANKYTVKPNDLIERIASDYGLTSGDILKANGLKSADLNVGQRLTIPNFDESITLLARIDAVSSVPDLPHGAKAAANLATALATLDHLASTAGIIRRKGIIFGFIDGDSLGGVGSRAFAEYVLRANNQLTASQARQKEEQNIFPVLALALCVVQLALIAWLMFRLRERTLTFKVAACAAVLVAGSAAILTAHQLTRIKPEDRLAEDPLARYQACLDWLAAPEQSRLHQKHAEWLGNEWFGSAMEQYRVKAAENRINMILRQIDSTDPQEKEKLGTAIKEADQKLSAIMKLRRATIENRKLDWPSRVTAFCNELATANSGSTALPINLDSIRSRLRSEYEQELQRHKIADANLALVKAILERLRPLTAGADTQPVAGWFLDLSDGTPSLGINSRAFRLPFPSAASATQFNKRFRNVIAYASVQAGWREQWSYLSDLDRNEQILLPSPTAACYSEFWSAANIGLLPLYTVNDQCPFLDTPRDVPEHTNFENLSVQARNTLLLVRLGLESVTDSLKPARLERPEFSLVLGRTLEFNIRSGIDAQEPIPNAYAYYPGLFSNASRAGVDNLANTSTHRGNRIGVVLITDLNGRFQTPLEAVAFNATPTIHCYRLNRERALFDKTLDQATLGTQKQDNRARLAAGREIEKRLVLTDIYPRVFFPATDPVNYASIGSSKKFDVLDAMTKGPPAHYAIEAGAKDFSESEMMSILMYLPVGRQAQIIVKEGFGFKMLLVGPADNDSEKGKGYYVGPTPDGDRNLTIPLTPLEIARDTQRMAKSRLDLYKRFGISNHEVEVALKRSGEKIAVAQAAADARDWQVATGAAREAWGILIRHYPRIMQLAREAVFSMVILMALLVPACVFAEQLILGAKSIVGHLAGVTGLFVACSVYLKYMHPAFKISVSPFIVMIAFLMILMAVVVLVICYQRFEVLVRRARIAGGEAESEEISLASSLATALNLGVSNLKKRMTRTILTTLTVSVLTFSIVAFVSVKGQDTLVRREIQLDNTVAGAKVEPIPPAYEGVLFRNTYWIPLSKDFVSSLRSEFGTQFDTTVRGHFIEAEGGGGATTEGANQIEIKFGKKSHVITGLMAYEPNEVRFSQLNRAVTNQQWLPDPTTTRGAALDRFTTIIPDVAAATLGITPEMIFDENKHLRPSDQLPQVRMMNLNWRVVGILDTGLADRMRDINGKSLAMVDYVNSAFASSTGGQADIITEPPSFHLPWKELAIIPLAATGDIRATPLFRSMVIRFGDASPEKVEQFFKDVTLRLNRSMFVGQGGAMSLVSARSKQSIAGVAKVVVPVILCILIVSNTMMGNVEERKGEVAMLGAVGLSPRQISFLLLSESTVFSVLGIVLGTFGGLLFANLVPWVSANFNGALAGLSFNFTSMSAVALALGTGAVVLLATLMPARKAAAVAAPSGMAKWQLPETSEDGRIEFELPFTMTRGNTVGMLAFFRRFLLNHTEATSTDFNCRNITVEQVNGETQSLRILADMWLSPYDLDVSQRMALDIHATDNPGVFRVRITLARSSGTEEAWLRTNYGFMDLVRQQFLLWRNLDHQARENYIAEGVSLFQSTGTKPASDR
jgi:LysM repeat protein